MENKSIAYFRNIGYDARMVDPGTDAQLFRPRCCAGTQLFGLEGRMWKSAKRNGD
jgi:hypothetical protein